MGREEELASSLPEPPPPAPARREAALEAALRRFDGLPPAPDRQRAPGRPSRFGRPQIALLASLMLVALVGAPAAWLSIGRHPELTPPPTASPPPAAEPVGASSYRASPAPAAPAGVPLPPPPVAEACRGAACVAPEAKHSPPSEIARLDAAPSLVAPAPTPPPAMVAQANTAAAQPAAPAPAPREERMAKSDEPMPVLARRAAPAPLADSAVDALRESDSSNIVVTGSKTSRKPVGRGDWNACTVNDPSRSLGRCRSAIAAAVPGAEARAAMAEGLEQAWSGDSEAAVAAFGRAIAQAPGSSFAYLNRGLALQRMGELDRALSDLDRAVGTGRASARAYYNRSELLRQHGQTKRADADLRRAANLDPRYLEAIQ